MSAQTEKQPGHKPPLKEDDLALVAACAAGDKRAQRKLVERVFDVVVATVSYAMNNPFYADDVVQDALLELLHSMKNYRVDCSLSTWTRKITLRVVYKQLRKKERRKGLLRIYPKPRPVWPQAEAELSNLELRRFLNELISRLPAKQATAIRLRYVHEHGIVEIAQILDAPEETVRVRIKRGRAKLQKMIAHHRALCRWLDDEESV